MIIPATSNAIFRTYPIGAIAVQSISHPGQNLPEQVIHGGMFLRTFSKLGYVMLYRSQSVKFIVLQDPIRTTSASVFAKATLKKSDM